MTRAERRRLERESKDDINQVLNDEIGLEVGNRSNRVSKEIYGGEYE